MFSCHRDACIAKPFANNVRVHPRGQEKARVGIPQVMEPDPMAWLYEGHSAHLLTAGTHGPFERHLFGGIDREASSWSSDVNASMS